MTATAELREYVVIAIDEAQHQGLNKSQARKHTVFAARTEDLDLRQVVHVFEEEWRPPTITTAGRFEIVWGDGIENLPDPEWLINGVIVRGSLSVLYGKSGVGKSFVSLDMAGAIASGMDWHGLDTHQGAVLYIAAEGIGDLGLRLEAMRHHRGIDSLANVGAILEPVNLMEREGSLNLSNLEDTSGAPPVLVIVDTLARSMVGGDENSAKDMMQVVADCQRLQEATGATVLIIHHTGKDGLQERGSSALLAAVDTHIKLVAATGRGGGIRLRCDKQKMASPFDPIDLALTPSRRSLAVTTAQAALSDRDRAAIGLLVDGPLTHAEWKARFTDGGRRSDSTFNRALGDIKASGFVRQVPSGSASRYELTQLGIEELSVTGVTQVSARD
jgi:archaellum biogenesis ATPase FlaH